MATRDDKNKRYHLEKPSTPPSVMPGRLPPQNVEAEQSVLGALLVDKDAIIKIADMIKPEDFYRDDHSQIYAACIKLFEKRRPIDLITLTEEFEKTKTLAEVGGASYLASLANMVPTAAHIVSYGQIVKEKATLRRLIASGTQIVGLGYAEERDVEEVLDEAERALFGVSQSHQHDQFLPIKDILASTFERIDELHKDKGKLRGVRTGFGDLDNLLAGLQPSDLILLAARPSIGKTSLALSIAEYVAVEGKIAVGVFSLEQSRDQLVDRMLSSVAGVDGWKLRTGNLNDDDFPKIGHAMGLLSEAPLFIDDTPLLNVMELRAKARRLQSEHGLGLIVIDYLQLIQGRSSRGDPNRVQEVSEISRSLKALARELNVPVLALSQLSRAVEQRPNKMPQLSDLRESGSLEQDADVVMFLYRDDYYDQETERKNIVDVLIRKHRNGPIGQIELFFVKEQTRFRSIEKKRS
ncbi:MAG: replicative DNA helicase [Patescibacteria group bacterium]